MKLENKVIGTYSVLTLIGLFVFIWVFNSVNTRFDRFAKRVETSKQRFRTGLKDKFEEMDKKFDERVARHHEGLVIFENALKAKRAHMKQEFGGKSADFLKKHQTAIENFDRQFNKVNSNAAEKGKDSNTHD